MGRTGPRAVKTLRKLVTVSAASSAGCAGTGRGPVLRTASEFPRSAAGPRHNAITPKDVLSHRFADVLSHRFARDVLSRPPAKGIGARLATPISEFIPISESFRFPSHSNFRVIPISESLRFPSHSNFRVITISESFRVILFLHSECIGRTRDGCIGLHSVAPASRPAEPVSLQSRPK